MLVVIDKVVVDGVDIRVSVHYKSQSSEEEEILQEMVDSQETIEKQGCHRGIDIIKNTLCYKNMHLHSICEMLKFQGNCIGIKFLLVFNSKREFEPEIKSKLLDLVQEYGFNVQK